VARRDVLRRSERERLIAAGLRLCASAAIEAPAEPTVRARPAPPLRAPATARLSPPLLGLPGVGPVTAERLAERGLRTAGDLLWFLPRRWEDLRECKPIAGLQAGLPQLTRGRVARVRYIPG